MASKRYNAIKSQIDATKHYTPEEAIALVLQNASAKFEESVDVSIGLGIDPKRSDQNVRGSTILPHGTGKSKRVAVFVTGQEGEDAAKAAGAEIVGDEAVIEKITKGDFDFDVLLTTPSDMPKLAKYGQTLGPKGLMPNPKIGTVSNDIKTAVENIKKGQVTFRSDRYAIVHCRIGGASFNADALVENLRSLFVELKGYRPASQKGNYFKSATLSSTMGCGLKLDLSTLT